MRRAVALIMALILPISLIVSIVLSLLHHPYASLALGITFATMLVFPVFYLGTVFPKHMADIYVRVKEKLAEWSKS